MPTFLQQTKKEIFITDGAWKEKALGFGWSWDDFNSSYMAERSPLPIYGNTIKWIQSVDTTVEPRSTSVYSVPEVEWKVRFNPDSNKTFSVERKRDENVFIVTEGNETSKEQEIPFVTNGITSGVELLNAALSKHIQLVPGQKVLSEKFWLVKSQPTDSLLKPMMHRSDNFFAEQALLMVSNERLGVMSISKITDTLLRSELKDLPQKPRWVDGSGLSRYNLFTPLDFVFILNKMKNEFDWKRITTIFPTGNEGTLANYYLTEKDFIYAKTGTLSGQVAISGYLITKKNRTLIFSVLINNHQTSATAVRRAVEKFLQAIREKY
ncbi:MAG: D-alanyl-D-alanine carboxypeptidase [Gemmatimonadaceae bacterium]|nr:D-alanyl-D-alanine carboxypeptidase [Chitinophagaceae bacterium]